VIDGLSDAVTMVTYIEGQVDLIDQNLDESLKNIRRQFGLRDEESAD